MGKYIPDQKELTCGYCGGRITGLHEYVAGYGPTKHPVHDTCADNMRRRLLGLSEEGHSLKALVLAQTELLTKIVDALELLVEQGKQQVTYTATSTIDPMTEYYLDMSAPAYDEPSEAKSAPKRKRFEELSEYATHLNTLLDHLEKLPDDWDDDCHFLVKVSAGVYCCRCAQRDGGRSIDCDAGLVNYKTVWDINDKCEACGTYYARTSGVCACPGGFDRKRPGEVSGVNVNVPVRPGEYVELDMRHQVRHNEVFCRWCGKVVSSPEQLRTEVCPQHGERNAT